MKIGHTGITWGIPGDVEQAYRETSELGYRGFETFSFLIMEWNKKPGGFRALCDRYEIPTSASYTFKEWIDPETADRELEEAKREAEALAELPGSATLVVQAGARPSGGYGREQFQLLAESLNKLGEHCKTLDLAVGLHPHTGTAIETRDDIDSVFEFLEPGVVGFAPDTGQLAKGGSDILEVIQTYKDWIVHVHLKDWNGVYLDDDGKETDRSGYLNYEAIGDGVLPFDEILKEFKSFGGWVNVELDGTERSPRSPKEAAERSRRFLAGLVGEDCFRAVT